MPVKTLLRSTVMCLSIQALSLGGETLKPSERPALLSHDELQKRLSDPSLRVVDVRSKADYEKGHIPGAVWFDPKRLEPLAKDERPTDKSAWSKVLARLGVGPDVEIVVYDDDSQHISAARVWFFLALASADREVGLVDGTFKSWERASRPVTTEAPAVALRDYDVKFNPSLRVGEAEVRVAALLGSDQLVDARTYEEYVGNGLCPISKQPLPGGRAGHIPSARLLDSSEVVDADGHFVDASALRALLSKAGISEVSPTIVYAKGGGRSNATVFALRRLGVPARHYVKGLNDWATDSLRPLVKGVQPGRVE
jgi:thiosulfate/3-mercaptopyruvate sulfurtransferase